MSAELNTREKISEHYDIDADGIIRSPGKFEGEPWWVPVLWDLCLVGFADEDFYDDAHGNRFTIKLCPTDAKEPWYDDVKAFTEGSGKVMLRETESGFVTAF